MTEGDIERWNNLLQKSEEELSKKINFPYLTVIFCPESDRSVRIYLAKREEKAVRVTDAYLLKSSKIPKEAKFVSFLLKSIKRQKEKIELITKIIEEIGFERLFIIQDHLLNIMDFVISIHKELQKLPLRNIKRTLRFIKNFKRIFVSPLIKFKILEGKGIGEFIYRLYCKFPSLFGNFADVLSKRFYKNFESIISDMKKRGGDIFPEEDIISLKKILTEGKI